jgi:hypothetical protein
MKKIYLTPAIETLEVRATFAICENSPGGGGVVPDPGFDPFKPAPGRKPF